MSSPPKQPLTGVASIEAILRVARYLPVFPCRARDEEVIVAGKPKLYKAKSPLTESGFKEATRDEETIRRWWSRWPGALVGVPMGSTTGLVAIDWDPEKHTDATGEWIERHTDALQSAKIHTTRRDGRHYLYKTAAGQRYQTGTDLQLEGVKRPGLDLRAEGGYIIWWPLHGGTVVNDQAPFLPAGLIDERLIRDTAPAKPAQSSPIQWEGQLRNVADALAFLEPGCDRDSWRNYGMGIHLASGGSDSGFNLWHAWSAGQLTGETPRSYVSEEDCRYHWDSFKDAAPRPVTLGTLYRDAKAKGFVWERQKAPESAQEAAGEQESAESGDESDLPAFSFHKPNADRFTRIPPRAFLYRRHYMRRMLGITAAAGGAGKSSVILVEMASLALGVDLFNDMMPLPVGPVNVWYHNGEDPADEIDRRVAALCRHYGIDPDLLAQHMSWTTGRESPLILARDIQGSVVFYPETISAVVDKMAEENISAMALDPLISTHRINENNNGQMDEVLSEWRGIADKADAAIEAVHHFRKANGGEPSMEDIRGASSITGAVRSARVIGSMSRDEAATAGIDPRERRRFIYELPVKANMYVAPDDRLWREMVSIDLENAAGPYESDKVGVATHWEFPSSITSLSDEYFASILGALRVADPMRRRASPKAIGWAGALVADTVGADIKDQSVRRQIASQLRSWLDRGVLETHKVLDPRQGREVDCISVMDRTD